LLRFLPVTFLLMGHQHVKNLVKICELFSMGQQIIGVFLKGSTSTGLGHNFMLLHSFLAQSHVLIMLFG
jgi:hypothetical protein